MITEHLSSAIQAIDDLLSRALPDGLHWLVAPVRRILEYLFGSVLDHEGRFPWWGLAAAVTITTVAFLRDRGVRSGGLLAFCFPGSVYRNPSIWVDLKVGFCNHVFMGGGLINVTWRLSGPYFGSWVTALLASRLGVPSHPGTWGPISIVLFALALSMASDFGYFLYHRAAHKFPPLWAIHKLHHSAEVMTPLTAARVHPLERVVMAPVMALTSGLIMGPMLYLYAGETHASTIFGMELFGVGFFLLGHVLHHSHVWVYFGPVVGRLIVSPAQHQIHHSCLPRHLDRNFAEHWAIWDTVFGTLYLPREREILTFGLAGCQTQPHTGVWMAWFRPVAESGYWMMSQAAYRVALAWRLIRRRDNPPALLPAGLEPDAG